MGMYTDRDWDELISHDALILLLDYNRDTGVFIWKRNPARSASWNTRYAGKNAGTVRPDGHNQISINKILYLSARLAWFYVYGTWPIDVDHKNRIRSDDRLDNLREVSRRESSVNRGKENARRIVTSCFKGVSRHHTGRWCARIEHDFLGNFDNEYEAALAYDKEAARRFGQFAALNFK